MPALVFAMALAQSRAVTGFVANQLAATRDSFPKPTFLPILLHTGLLDERADGDRSGIPDLNYLFLGKDILEPKTGFDITVKDDMDILIPLAQGPLPLPIKANSTSGIVDLRNAVVHPGRPLFESKKSLGRTRDRVARLLALTERVTRKNGHPGNGVV